MVNPAAGSFHAPQHLGAWLEACIQPLVQRQTASVFLEFRLGKRAADRTRGRHLELPPWVHEEDNRRDLDSFAHHLDSCRQGVWRHLQNQHSLIWGKPSGMIGDEFAVQAETAALEPESGEGPAGQRTAENQGQSGENALHPGGAGLKDRQRQPCQASAGEG